MPAMTFTVNNTQRFSGARLVRCGRTRGASVVPTRGRFGAAGVMPAPARLDRLTVLAVPQIITLQFKRFGGVYQNKTVSLRVGSTPLVSSAVAARSTSLTKGRFAAAPHPRAVGSFISAPIKMATANTSIRFVGSTTLNAIPTTYSFWS